MILHKLEKPPGATRKPKRKGRGPGSTLGKTAGRGQKGQRARGTVRRGFEGGQTPLHRRLPRRGFTNIFKEHFAVINLSDLVKRPALAEKSEITPADLVEAGAIRGSRQAIVPEVAAGETQELSNPQAVFVPKLRVKVLGNGEIDRAVKVHAHRFSRSAMEKIAAAGGEAVIIEVRSKILERRSKNA